MNRKIFFSLITSIILVSNSPVFSFSELSVITSDSTYVEEFQETTTLSTSSESITLGTNSPIVSISELVTKNSTKWNNKIPQSINSYHIYKLVPEEIKNLAENN